MTILRKTEMLTEANLKEHLLKAYFVMKKNTHRSIILFFRF